MKKQFLACVSLVAVMASELTAQQQKPTLQICNTYDAMQQAFDADPNLQSKYLLVQTQLESEYLAQTQALAQKTTAATIYTIPVVFHVMGTQNVPDQVFIDAIAQVNKDYSKTGSDVSSINSNFSALYVDAEMRFALAKKDPNGNCTNGIIRHDQENIYWSQTSSTYNFSGTGTNRWPVNQYLNIYIVNCIESPSISCPPSGGLSLGGYTYLPGSAPSVSADAIVYLARLLGQTNITDVRALSHEIGHWFNLRHTFGSTNSPGVSCGDDGISDTPPTMGTQSSCPSSTSNSCTGSGGLWNVENFMDYSSCPKMFTQGQVTAMRTAVVSATAGRNNLWTNANLLATGIIPGYTCLPVADFKVDKVNTCLGTAVTFTSLSQSGSTPGSLLWSFDGATPAMSTSTSQVVNYAIPGTYSVSLKVTNPDGSNTLVRSAFVSIIDPSGAHTAPDTYDFEVTGLSGISVINEDAGSVAWQQNQSLGANSTSRCISLDNASQTNTAGDVDIFETPFYDVHNTTNLTFSYFYSYAKKTASQIDTFKLQYSVDCGGSWTNVFGFPNAATMATNTGGTTSSAFVPTSTQWRQVTISSALLAAINNKPSVKFRFYFRSDFGSAGSNNIYIDQINLSGTVGIHELENAIGLSIYPNPTSSSSTIDFTLQNSQSATITVLDMLGRVLDQSNVLPAAENHIVYTVNKQNTLAKGMYLVNIRINNEVISKKLIIE